MKVCTSDNFGALDLFPISRDDSEALSRTLYVELFITILSCFFLGGLVFPAVPECAKAAPGITQSGYCSGPAVPGVGGL